MQLSYLMSRLPPRSTRTDTHCPNTTLFRSIRGQPVQDIGSLTDRCQDDMGCERGILLGHMAVSLEARDVAIFRVDQIHRLALLGSKEGLPVAGCRLPLSPEGGHGQGGVGLHDHGERPIIGAAFDMPARDRKSTRLNSSH